MNLQKNRNFKKNNSNSLGKTIGDFFKSNWKHLVIMLLALVLSLCLAAWKSTKVQYVNFNINDYEVGQTSDITIKSPASLEETDEFEAIQKDEVIVKKGFEITEEQYAKMLRISELNPEFNPKNFFNDFIYLMIICLLSLFFFSKIVIGKKIDFKETLMLSIFFLISYGACIGASLSAKFSSPYSIPVIIPSSLFVFLTCILFASIDGIYFSIIQALLVLNASNYEIIPFLYVFLTSLSSVYIVRSIKNRLQLVSSGIVIALMNCLVMALLKVINGDFFAGFWYIYLELAANGFMSSILCLGFMTPLEYILNTPTVFRLMDLSDRNNEVLQKLFLTANGTYQHSEMVAQLAEDGCRAIGANALLARVAALYHDIGKMDRPEYFTENQVAGEENKHNVINPSLSVTIIRDHIKRSVEMVREIHMPQVIEKIISEHHGNQVIKVFYEKAKEKDPNVNVEDYSYPGNPPSSRESAVVMLADTAEAACRSLQNPTGPRIERFIDSLVQQKYDAHQLDEADLTFKDLTLIKKAFVQVLTGFYHSRVQYPGQKDPDGQKNENAQNPNSQNNSEQNGEPKKIEESDKNQSAKESGGEAKAESSKKADLKSSKKEEKSKSVGQKKAEKTGKKALVKSEEKKSSAKKTALKK